LHPEALQAEESKLTKRPTADSDIALCFGEEGGDTVLMGKKELSRKSEYFAIFEPDTWPIRFVLPAEDAPSPDLVIPVGSAHTFAYLALTG
jgi:hypothetical protein